MYVVFTITFLLLFFGCLILLEPKLDWNYQTNERILWFNIPWENKRTFIVLYKRES